MSKLIKKMALCSVAIILEFLSFSVLAQVSFGGKPLKLPLETVSLRFLAPEASVFKIDVPFNSDDLRSTLQWQQHLSGGPMIVGRSIAVNKDLFSLPFVYFEANSYSIYRVVLEASEAQAISVTFSRLHLHSGQRLYVMDSAEKYILGAFTKESNPDGGSMSTEPLPGQKVVLQLEIPLSSSLPQIEIAELGYFFNLPTGALRSMATLPNNISGEGASSELCQVNVNCPEGDKLRDVQNGIVHIITSIEGNIAYCSGTLLNNTAQDFRPLIITAAHCSIYREVANGKVINVMETSDEEFRKWVFVFHYERPYCQDNYFFNNRHLSISGAKKLVRISDDKMSDGLLLELLQPIPDHYGVYYNGWDNSGGEVKWANGLHHPRGDVMKVATVSTPLGTGTWLPGNSVSVGGKDDHWVVRFSKTESGHGVTDPGSSGSGLFNEEQLLIGTLTGGASDCAHVSLNNFYGKLSCHWDKYAAQEATMAPFLDPKERGTAKQLKGSYKPGAVRLMEPKGFKGILNNGVVSLEWEKPESFPVGVSISYIIMRNGVEIASLSEEHQSFVDPKPQAAQGIATYGLKVRTRLQSVDFYSAESLLSFYLSEPEGVRDLRVVSEGTVTKVSWRKPIHRQRISQRLPSSSLKALEPVDYPGAAVSLQDIYLGNRYNGTDFMAIGKARLSAVEFVAARGSKLHSYELFIRNGYKHKVDQYGNYSAEKDDNSTVRQAKITKTFAEGDKISFSGFPPMMINPQAMLVVGIKLHSETDLRKKVFMAYDAPAAETSALHNVISFDNRYWMPGNYAFNKSFDQSKNMSFAIDFIIDDAELNDSVLSDGFIPTGYVPASFPKVKEYQVLVNGSVNKVVPAGTMEVQLIGVKDGDKVDVFPVYQDGRVANAVERILGEKKSPEVYPTIVKEEVNIKSLAVVISMKVFDSAGQMIYSTTRPEEKIDSSHWTAGNYLLSLCTSEGSYVFRLLKE